VVRRRFVILGAVDQQNRRLDSRGGEHRTGRIDTKASLLFSNAEGLVDLSLRCKKRRTFGCHRAQVREAGDRDDAGNAIVLGGRLQRDGRPQRRSDQNDRPLWNCIDHATQIAFLEESISAGTSSGFTMGAAVVGQNRVSARQQVLRKANARRAIVCGTVEEDDGPQRGSGGAESPAAKGNAFAGERDIFGAGGRRTRDRPVCWMEQRARAPRRRHATAEKRGSCGEQNHCQPGHDRAC
jgi:hypothetical protein